MTACLGLAMYACSGSSGLADGGDADGVDGDNWQRDAGCQPANDEFEGLWMRFEAGAQGCTAFNDFLAWQASVEYASRITFIPGIYPLQEFQQGEVEADWIERIEVGQDKLAATKLGSGLLTYEFLETGVPDEGCHRYYYSQPFSLDPHEYTLEATITFCLESGEPKDPEICFAEDYTRGRAGFFGFIGDRQDPIGYQHFGPCYYNDIPLWIIDIGVENGDSLLLHKRFEIPVAGSGPARIVYAEGSVASAGFQVEDPCRLIYAAEHHNWNQEYVVIFVPPLGDVHGLYTMGVEEGANPATLRYLDAALGELRTAVITDIEIQGPL